MWNSMILGLILGVTLSPKHLTKTATDTKDTRGTAGTTVIKVTSAQYEQMDIR